MGFCLGYGGSVGSNFLSPTCSFLLGASYCVDPVFNFSSRPLFSLCLLCSPLHWSGSRLPLSFSICFRNRVGFAIKKTFDACCQIASSIVSGNCGHRYHFASRQTSGTGHVGRCAPVQLPRKASHTSALQFVCMLSTCFTRLSTFKHVAVADGLGTRSPSYIVTSGSRPPRFGPEAFRPPVSSSPSQQPYHFSLANLSGPFHQLQEHAGVSIRIQQPL